MQPALQARGAEGIRYIFFHHMFVGQGVQRILELAARLAWPEHRSVRAGDMPHMNDRALRLAPGIEQLLYVQLSVWVVAAPKGGIGHAFLHIDDQQCGVRRYRFHDLSWQR